MIFPPETEIGQQLLASTPLYPIARIAERLLSIDRLDEIYNGSRRGGEFFSGILRQLQIRWDCSPDELARVPSAGPVVVVSNHPFGLVEAPVLAALLSQRRKDFRFLANSMLAGIEILRDHLIPVDPFGGAARSNALGLRAAIEWVRAGKLLVVFPSGEVSSLRLPQLRVADPEWDESISRIVRITRAVTVPFYFHGNNSAAFLVAGMIHPRLRTALLPRELMQKEGRTIRVSVGLPIEPRETALSNRDLTGVLRMRTELLQGRQERRPPRAPQMNFQRIAFPGDRMQLRQEVDRLEVFGESGRFRVYLADSKGIPEAIREIGRLREITFRAAGEGTGRARDLDRFDSWYKHLFIWDAEHHEIAGAYRLGLADSILSEHGSNGLYTSTLFRFEPRFLRNLGPSIELGRSFIVPEYQKEYLPLLLLWKGISRFVLQNPRYRTLFGPVSISNDYGPISRALMVGFCKAQSDPDLAAMVKPRRAFHTPSLPGCEALLGRAADNVAELSELIADLEPDRKGVPVLLRQYLNLGAKVLAFNVDPHFANAVDGLIVVDLLKTDLRLLARYMGRDGIAEFLKFHTAGCDCSSASEIGRTA